MATRIIPKKSTVAAKVPLDTDLEIGEIAINLTDRKLYSKNASGEVVEIGGASSAQTPEQILTDIKTVDGDSSGLDADLLDGQQGSYYLDWTNVTNKPDPVVTLSGDVSGSATMTDLGSITITVTVADDSHNHDGRYYTETEIDTKLADGSVTKFDPSSTDTFTGTYPIVWHDNNITPYTSTWFTINGATDTLNVPNINLSGNVTVGGTVDGRDVAADGAKLDGIEAGATADQTITAGAGLTGGGTGNVTISHADTSTQASVNNSSGTVIQDITLDTYGHITSIGSINLDSRYYTETESDAKYAPIFETISGVETWNKVHAAWTDSTGANTYIVITTNVPQDAYVMGGFELTLENNYSASNEGDTVRIYGYWNPEANGGFIGFKYHATNPNFNPTIQVARNSSGNTVFIISGESTNYTQVIARNLWTGYNSSGANATWGDNWTITDTADISGYTNNNTVVRTGLLPHTLTLNGDVSGSVTLDGYSNKTMTITVADDSHNHTIANVDGLQSALNSKANISGSTSQTFNASVLNATVVNAGTVDLGNWTITETVGGELMFASGGVNKMKLDASGNLSVVGDINTNATL